MKNKTKKGFTLVELLVVIAILAILATVSVVGYTSFIAKANLSNDQTTIGMINDNLTAQSVAKKPASASEAIDNLYAVGFSNEKLVAYSTGYHYVYNLDENKFYLVDDTDKIVYPAEKTADANFWALYRNQDTDKITGFTNYVAMEPVVAQDKFDIVFASGNYKVDLNHLYIGVTKPESATIKLINGIITPDATGYDTTDESMTTLVKEEQGTSVSVSGADYLTSDKLIVMTKDAVYFNNETETITYENCTFTSHFQIHAAHGTKIVIKDCTFVGNGDDEFALTIYNALEGDITLSGNTFINCGRGLHVGFDSDDPKYGKQISSLNVENNTFKLVPNSNGKSSAIQVSNIKAANLPTPATTLITIRNNVVDSANAAVRIHDTTDDVPTLADYIAFKDNKVADGIITVNGDGTTVSDATAATLATKFR